MYLTNDVNRLTSSLGVDLGFLFRWSPEWFLGAVYQGLNEPEPSFSFNNQGTLRTAIAYHSRSFSLTFQANRTQPLEGSGKDLFFTLAGETLSLANHFARADLALRGAFSVGPARWRQFQAGLGYSLQAVTMDYAWVAPFHEDRIDQSPSQHRLTLSYSFGKALTAEDPRVNRKFFLDRILKTLQVLEFYDNQARLGEAEREQLRARLVQQGIDAGQHVELYGQAMDPYWAKKDAGASLKERTEYLKILIEFFKTTRVNIRSAEKELWATEQHALKMRANFQRKWKEYVQNAAQGESWLYRVEFLANFVEKFAFTGEIGYVKDELEDLTRG